MSKLLNTLRTFFCIITKVNINRQYESGLKRQNRLLKILAKMAGIGEGLSTHTGRHSNYYMSL